MSVGCRFVCADDFKLLLHFPSGHCMRQSPHAHFPQSNDPQLFEAAVKVRCATLAARATLTIFLYRSSLMWEPRARTSALQPPSPLPPSDPAFFRAPASSVKCASFPLQVWLTVAQQCWDALGTVQPVRSGALLLPPLFSTLVPTRFFVFPPNLFQSLIPPLPSSLFQAIECLLGAAAIKPDDANIYSKLGLNYGKSGNLDSAMQAFDAALALDPTHAMARSNKAVALERMGKQEVR